MPHIFERLLYIHSLVEPSGLDHTGGTVLVPGRKRYDIERAIEFFKAHLISIFF